MMWGHVHKQPKQQHRLWPGYSAGVSWGLMCFKLRTWRSGFVCRLVSERQELVKDSARSCQMQEKAAPRLAHRLACVKCACQLSLSPLRSNTGKACPWLPARYNNFNTLVRSSSTDRTILSVQVCLRLVWSAHQFSHALAHCQCLELDCQITVRKSSH
jgi:hypothetical protein